MQKNNLKVNVLCIANILEDLYSQNTHLKVKYITNLLRADRIKGMKRIKEI